MDTVSDCHMFAPLRAKLLVEKRFFSTSGMSWLYENHSISLAVYNFPEELLASIASDCKMGESVKTKPASCF